MKPKTSPKDFFLYLALIATLYVVVVSILRLWFSTINGLFPDPLQYYSYGFEDGSLRAAIAALVVVFPIHLFLARTWNGEMRRTPEKQDIWVRKWLIYLTLFVAGVTLAIDLIVLIERFLGGELTARFFLKVAAVFAAAGLSFWYFLYDLKRDVAAMDPRLKMFALGATGLLVLSIIGGFLIIGSPKSARLEQLDNERVMQLQNIEYQVAEYWRRYKELPTDLSLMVNTLGFVAPTDPESNEAFGYRVISGTSFELCATFSTDNKVSKTTKQPYGYAPAASPVRIDDSFFIEGGSWEHGTGTVCFTREIQVDKSLDVNAPIKR